MIVLLVLWRYGKFRYRADVSHLFEYSLAIQLNETPKSHFLCGKAFKAKHKNHVDLLTYVSSCSGREDCTMLDRLQIIFLQ